jgi:hypothetical protein
MEEMKEVFYLQVLDSNGNAIQSTKWDGYPTASDIKTTLKAWQPTSLAKLQVKVDKRYELV